MSGTPLASVAQLAAFLDTTIDDSDPTALLYLDIASAMVTDYLQQQLVQVNGDQVELDPINGYLLLPEMPVTSVSDVESYDRSTATWSQVDPQYYTVSRRLGMIAIIPNSGMNWPTDPESWRVTYDHGFSEIPDGIMGVVLNVAARAYTSAPGVESERIGGYQVKYDDGDSFTDVEQRTLNRYVVARIA